MSFMHRFYLPSKPPKFRWAIALNLLALILLPSCGLAQTIWSSAQAGSTSAAESTTIPEPNVTVIPLTMSGGGGEKFNQVLWLPDGNIALAAQDELIILPAEGQTFRTQALTSLKGNLPTLITAAISKQSLAWVSNGNQVFAYDPAANPAPQLLGESVSPITGLALSADGELLAYASYDGGLIIVSRRDPANVQGLATRKLPVWLSSLSISPDGKRIAGASLPDFTVYILDASNGETLQMLEWVNPAVSSFYGVAFSNDWSRLAWLSQSAVLLMTLPDGKNGPVLNHEENVSALAWSPDGDRLAVASAATVQGNLTPAVILWDASNGAKLATLPQDMAILSLAFSPDGSQIAALDGAGELRVIRLK
jgi:WD40 repeat protein